MARPLLFLLLLPPPLLPFVFPTPPPKNVSEPGCSPGWLPCEPGAPCFHREWLCDGHPDCEDERDERGCGTETPTPAGAVGEAPLWGSEASVTPVPEGSETLRSEGRLWILVIAVLLSILVAVASIAEWALSKAKKRCDIFSLENSYREQLMSAKSQTDAFP